ncbi:MAG: sigma-70 family RNA polymerase sigma factor [Bacteroidales bacterium]|nr:sigma-70 family RNA polymerase sigma factor [Bacteroidales bacterium]
MTRSEFEHIAERLRQKVLKVGLQFFGSQDDAEDAAQETMEQLWRYCEQIDASRDIEALAIRVAKNCCVSMYRRNRTTTSPSLYGGERGSSPQEILEAKDTERMLEEALDLLKPRERQLFEMRQLEGLSIDEISSETGIPKPSITAMVSAARRKVFIELKRRMKQ